MSPPPPARSSRRYKPDAYFLSRLIPIVGPVIAFEYGWNGSSIGYLTASNSVGGLAMLMVGSALIRKVGGVRMLQLVLLLGAVSMGLFLFPSLSAAFVVCFAMGLSTGMSSPAGSEVLQRFAKPGRRNLMFSIKQAGVPLGGMVAGLLVPVIVVVAGWPVALLVCALLVCGITLSTWRLSAMLDYVPGRDRAHAYDRTATASRTVSDGAVSALSARYSEQTSDAKSRRAATHNPGTDTFNPSPQSLAAHKEGGVAHSPTDAARAADSMTSSQRSPGSSGNRGFSVRSKPLRLLTAPVASLMRGPGLFKMASVGALFAIAQSCWFAFTVLYLIDGLGYSLGLAGVVFSVMQVGAVIGRIVLGWLSDLVVSAKTTLIIAAVVSAVTTILLGLSTAQWPLWTLIVLAFIAGGSVASWNGVQLAEMARLSPPGLIAETAAGAAVLNSAVNIAAPSFFAAWVAATGRYDVAFVVVGICSLLVPLVVPRQKSGRNVSL